MCVCVWDGRGIFHGVAATSPRCSATQSIFQAWSGVPSLLVCTLFFLFLMGTAPQTICARHFLPTGVEDFMILLHIVFFFPTDIGPYELFLQWRGAEELAQKVLILWRLWGNRSQCIEWYMSHSSQIVIKLKVHLRASRLIHILQLCFTWIHLYYFLTIVWLNLKGLVWRI